MNTIFSDWITKKQFSYNGVVYKQGVNDNSASVVLAEIAKKMIEGFPKMMDAEKVANKHFTDGYEDLNSEYQHEHEGITWGWQDCCETIKNNIENLKIKS